jgi:hypothetical protein
VTAARGAVSPWRAPIPSAFHDDKIGHRPATDKTMSSIDRATCCNESTIPLQLPTTPRTASTLIPCFRDIFLSFDIE